MSIAQKVLRADGHAPTCNVWPVRSERAVAALRPSHHHRPKVSRKRRRPTGRPLRRVRDPRRARARQVRAVFRHALGVSPRGPFLAVSLRADQHGLTIRSKSRMAAIERSVLGGRRKTAKGRVVQKPLNHRDEPGGEETWAKAARIKSSPSNGKRMAT